MDVGMGVGTYGFLCAAAFDPGRLVQGGHRRDAIRIDAIEGFPEYIGDVQRAIYDTIYLDDLRSLLPTIKPKTYDLLLLIDVLEHVEPEQVRAVLASCRGAARSLIVSTPLGFAHQHDLDNNAFQVHRSHPQKRELQDGGLDLLIPDDSSLIMFGSDDKNFVRYYRTRLRRAAIRSALPQVVRRNAGHLRTIGRSRASHLQHD